MINTLKIQIRNNLIELFFTTGTENKQIKIFEKNCY